MTFNHTEYGAKEFNFESSIRGFLSCALQDAETIDFETEVRECIENPEKLIQIAWDCWNAKNGYGFNFGNVNVTANKQERSEFAQENQEGNFISLVWNSQWTPGRWVHWELDINNRTAIVEWQTGTGEPSKFINPLLEE